MYTLTLSVALLGVAMWSPFLIFIWPLVWFYNSWNAMHKWQDEFPSMAENVLSGLQQFCISIIFFQEWTIKAGLQIVTYSKVKKLEGTKSSDCLCQPFNSSMPRIPGMAGLNFQGLVREGLGNHRQRCYPKPRKTREDATHLLFENEGLSFGIIEFHNLLSKSWGFPRNLFIGWRL